MSAFDDFRALHRPGTPLVLPNAWDYSSAAALVAAGFRAIGTTSLGVATANGLPDGGGHTLAASTALARLLGRLPCLLTVDIEAGFTPPDRSDGAPTLAAELVAAGAVGINIEDGRADGRLADGAEQARLIGAVKAGSPRLFVNARIDAYWQAAVGSAGRPAALDDVIERARAYVAAGADGIFVPSLLDPDDIRRLVNAVDAPINLLYAPGRHTVEELARLGVARISTGSLLFRATVRAAVRSALAVAVGGPIDPDIPGYAEIAGLTANGPSGPPARG